MKKIPHKLAVAITALMAFPFVLYLAASVVSFAVFYITLAGTDTNSCIHYYEGVNKGTVWNHGEWHPYRQLFGGVLHLYLISFVPVTDGLPTDRTPSRSVRGEYVYWIRKYTFGNKIIQFGKRVFTKAT